MVKKLRDPISSKIIKKKKWYYDACALELKEVFGLMITNSSKRHIINITSHLSIGEAFGNCHIKGEEKIESFIELMNKLSKHNALKIVGNDRIEKQVVKIQDKTSLSMTDTIHFATALKYDCEMLVTKDRDFIGIPKKQIKDLANEFKISSFSIFDLNKKSK